MDYEQDSQLRAALDSFEPTYREAEAEPRKSYMRGPIPEGRYSLMVDEAKFEISKTKYDKDGQVIGGGNAMLVWTLKVVAGPQKGALVRKFHVLKNDKDSLARLVGDLDVAGIKVPPRAEDGTGGLAELPDLIQSAVGAVIEATVKIQKDNPDNNVVYFNRSVSPSGTVTQGEPTPF